MVWAWAKVAVVSLLVLTFSAHICANFFRGCLQPHSGTGSGHPKVSESVSRIAGGISMLLEHSKYDFTRHNKLISAVAATDTAACKWLCTTTSICLREWGRRRGLLGPRRPVPPTLILWATWCSTGWAEGLATDEPTYSPLRGA
eukprot:3538361-Pleurochrysis_carterae.AAC.1